MSVANKSINFRCSHFTVGSSGGVSKFSMNTEHDPISSFAHSRDLPVCTRCVSIVRRNANREQCQWLAAHSQSCHYYAKRYAKMAEYFIIQFCRRLRSRCPGNGIAFERSMPTQNRSRNQIKQNARRRERKTRTNKFQLISFVLVSRWWLCKRLNRSMAMASSASREISLKQITDANNNGALSWSDAKTNTARQKCAGIEESFRFQRSSL